MYSAENPIIAGEGSSHSHAHHSRRNFAKLHTAFKIQDTRDKYSSGMMSTAALLPQVHSEFSTHINQLRQANQQLNGSLDTSSSSSASMEHLFSNSFLCVHSLTQFYKIQRKINDLHNAMLKDYPLLPKNYYRKLNVILKMIDMHYLNVHTQPPSREQPLIKRKNQVAHDSTSPISSTDDAYFFLKKDLHVLERKIFRIVKSHLIAKWQAISVELSSITKANHTQHHNTSSGSPLDKLLSEVLWEIHQWNKLLKRTWDTFSEIHESQIFFANILSHQISLRELCVRACDARFCCIHARGKLPKRVRLSSNGGVSFGQPRKSSVQSVEFNPLVRRPSISLALHNTNSHIESQSGRRFSGSSMHGNGGGKKQSPEKSETVRFTDRLDFSSLTIDPFYDSDNYSVGGGSPSSRDSSTRFSPSHGDSVRYQLGHHFLSSEDVKCHIDSIIGDEYECIKKLIATIESMDECYLPLFDTDLNGYLFYRYFRHKTHASVRTFSHASSGSTPSVDQSSHAPTTTRFINEGAVIDHSDVNRLINEQRLHQYSSTGSMVHSASAGILESETLLEHNQEEQLFVPVYGSTISQIKEFYIQYFSIQTHRFVNFADGPSVMGVNALVSGVSSGASLSLDPFGNSPLSLRTNLEQFNTSLNDVSPNATIEQARTQLQREFMKLLPNMNRFAAKEDFNFHRRYSEVQKTELLSCQTHLFSHIYTFLKDISTRYETSSAQDSLSSNDQSLDDTKPSHAEQQRLLQELVNEYLVKVVRFMTNFAHKHTSGYLKIPRLQNMCILHSELTHFMQMMNEVFQCDVSKHRKMHQKTDSVFISYSATSPKSEISLSLRKLDQLRDTLRDKLTEEICDISTKFWFEEYKDNQKKKGKSMGLGIICCSGSMTLSSPVETNQGQVQRAIDIILQPSFESIACSHPESRSILTEKFVTTLLTTYLDYIKRLGLKHQKRKKHLLWSVMRRFRSDMIFFHNWIMQTPLLSKMEKQLVIRFGVFDKIDSILLELDATTKSTKNRSAKYSIATNPSDNITLQLKKSSIVPEESSHRHDMMPEKIILHSNCNGKIQHRRSSSWFHPVRSEPSSMADHTHHRSLSDESNKSAVRDLSEWQSIFAAL